jgi:3-dehydroquinate synthase
MPALPTGFSRMQTLTVALDDRSYPIYIGSGLLHQAALVQAAVGNGDVLLVSNVTVAPLHGDALRSALAGHRVVEVLLPDGEQHKSLATSSRVFDVLVANRMARDSVIVALGGGVVGDLAGFVAACYQRGVDFVQVPTTLVAQVDSSVGGKTAVNHPGAKNMIGAFHQPRAVVADTDVLATLPDRELRAGLAEVIKYGLICDARFFGWLEQNMPKLLARDPAALAHAIFRSCEIKADFVARDEREQGERALLNLGHTFGHAIEAATGYVEWLHGEAVGAGMLVAADLSHRLGMLGRDDVQRIEALLHAAGLRTQPPRIGAAKAAGYMSADKKVQAGRVRLVLMQGLGSSRLVADYDDAALQAALQAHFGP